MPLLPQTLAEDFLHNPTGSLVTIRCQPWHVGGRVVLLGDACHAVVPFLGQGMNAAFEDCTVLHECLRTRLTIWGGRLRVMKSCARNTPTRWPTSASTTSVRCAIASARAGSCCVRELGILLHRLFPRWYLPLYTMIEFTRIPYAAALRRARRQDRVVLGIGVAVAVIAAVACFGLWNRLVRP